MEVQTVMSKSVRSVDASEPISKAARIMGEADVGSLPVLDNGKLVGIVTDRDVAVGAVGNEVKVSNPVERVMTRDVQTCKPDADVEDVLEIMGDQQIRRMPVCDDEGSVVGIVSIGDLIRKDPDQQEVAEALSEICKPSTRHCQQVGSD